jgi:uncharacterized protein (TIGR02271 family)
MGAGGGVSDTRSNLEGVLPLVEEDMRINKREVTTGRVRVSTRTIEHTELARLDLASDDVEVVRVAVGREVSEAPQVRVEGQVTIIPVLEEVMVVEKRLVLREELHVRRTRTVETFQEPIALRRQEAVVERVAEDTREENKK